MSFAKSRRLRSLGLRLTAWYVLVFVGSTFLLATAADFQIRRSMREQIVRTLSSNLDRHKQAFVAAGLEGLRHLTESPQPGERKLYVRVVNSADVTIFEKANAGLSFAAGTTPGREPSVHPVREKNSDSLWNVASTPLPEGHWLQIGISDEQTAEMFGHLRAGLVAVWIGAVVLGLIGGFLLTRRALRPVRQLAATARHVIASGDLALRVVEPGTRDELDELSHLFNGVLAHNQKLVKGMRDVLENVAHDIRTPLTRLRTGAEVALRDSTDPQRTREALADTLEESDHVLAMLNTLMDISGAETGVIRLDREMVDISDLARAAVDLYQEVAEEKGLRVLTHLAVGATATVDRIRLGQVIANLVDNAIKYTPAGGTVEITTEGTPPSVKLMVKDSGMGISAEDLPRIWQRFYRADRSRSQPGLGLGLSLVKAIVEAHGGQVEAQSTLGVGSTFAVTLPGPPMPTNG